MKLSESILEHILTQEDMAAFYANIKNKEKTYKKRPLKLKYRIAQKGEKIDTIIDGEKETQNVTKDGDFIIIGVKGENYVLPPSKVKENYVIIDNETIATKPVKIKAKLYTGKDIQFKTSWGENMILKNSDYLVKNDDEYYRIEKNIFTELYIRCG